MDLPLPVEPLYSLDTAAQLIPTTPTALKRYIERHKSDLAPPHYRKWRRIWRRMLTASDIVLLRSRLVHAGSYPRRSRPTPPPHEPPTANPPIPD